MSQKPMSDDDKLKELNKEDMIISIDGTVKEMPQKNKKCPCKSKKNYKNCKCYISDLERKTEFITRMTRKIEIEKPK